MKTRRNLILIWLLCAALLPAAVQAEDYIYTTNSDNTITITAYIGLSDDVIIPNFIDELTVTSIGNGAFADNWSLASVTIGTNVTSIGDSAFSDCGSLTNITIGTNVASIGSHAFDYCPSLTNIMIGGSVTNIGDEAFGDCDSLTAITVAGGNSVYASLDGVLFNKSRTTLIQCPGGKAGSYTVPNSATNIAGYAFYVCASLTNITIPNSVTRIGSNAFSGDFILASITIPNGLASIEDAVFADCWNLTSISIPGSVTNIGGEAFSYCGLTNITIPDSVISIGDMAFYGCANLAGITMGNNVTSIGTEAFYACSSLINVTIPGSVTSIGDGAFEYCTGLMGVYFKGNAPGVGSDVFGDDGEVIIYYLPRTTGWTPTPPFGALPMVLWNPQVQTDARFGVRTNQFGFTISGTRGLVIVVEACTNLANPVWFPVGTNALIAGSSYFSDPQWTNSPGRFYRLRARQEHPCTVQDNGMACDTGKLGICAAGTTMCINGVIVCNQTEQPRQETCNGLDDDCNGVVDDGLGTTTCGVGACQRTVQSCVNGKPQACVPGAPKPETCNGIDDDCDGVVDNDNPGGGVACVTGLPGICAAGTTRCVNGAIVCQQNQQPRAETCNGLDDNCNGVVDDGNPGGGTACNTGQPGVCAAGTTVCTNGAIACVVNTQTCGVGACQRTMPICVNGMPQACIPGTPTPEICNGIDDDCEGNVDNGNPGGGLACNTGLPGICALGTTACINGALVCQQNQQARAETCNGLDDNCNGQVDDGNPGGGVACNTGQPGVCAAGTTVCTNGAIACVINTQTCGVGACRRTMPICVNGMPQACVPGTPTAEICNGIDDDCDGTVDGGNPGGGLNCNTGGAGECTNGTTVCINGVIVCESYGGGTTTCGVGACQRTVYNCVNGQRQICVPGMATPETCNGIDDDCNGLVDEGNPGGGLACNTGLTGACALGTTVCSNGAISCVPNQAGCQ